MTRTELDTIRVAHVIDTLNVGGAEQLLVEQCRHGRAVGISSTVIGLRPGTSNQLSDALESVGADVRLVGSSQRRQLLDFRRIDRLAAEIRSGRFDVVHTHLRVSTIIGSLAARRADVPVVCTLHNVRAGGRGGVLDRAKSALETYALQHWIDLVIGCGPAVAESNLQRVGDRPLVVVANPVRRIDSPSDEARHELRGQLLGDGDQLIVSVGRLTEQKDYGNLLRATAELAATRDGIRVVIVGEGAERRTLEETIDRLGLSDVVTLPGNRRDVPAVLSVSDIFVLPSAWEGLPLALLEAMAAGVPIVATDVGDVAGVMGETGSLVPPRDASALARAMVTLLDDRAGARERADEARRRVLDRHSPSAWVGELRAVYDRVLER